MTELVLTKTGMKQGIWQGIITGAVGKPPVLRVTHLETPLPDVSVSPGPKDGDWTLRVPIPTEVIADGVQTILINDAESGEKLGSVSLIAGEALGDDLRAEVDLLRAELDMLKRAFRRHCLETA